MRAVMPPFFQYKRINPLSALLDTDVDPWTVLVDWDMTPQHLNEFEYPSVITAPGVAMTKVKGPTTDLVVTEWENSPAAGWRLSRALLFLGGTARSPYRANYHSLPDRSASLTPAARSLAGSRLMWTNITSHITWPGESPRTSSHAQDRARFMRCYGTPSGHDGMRHGGPPRHRRRRHLVLGPPVHHR
eukprot:9422434-Pyramimonas_sp.AAC.1